MEEQVFFDFELRFNLRQYKHNKPTIVYAVFTYEGKQIKVNTNTKVYPTQWNSKKQIAIISNGQTRLDNNNNKVVNDMIKKINIAFENEKLYLCNNVEEISNIIFRIKNAINPKYRNQMGKKNEPEATYILLDFASKKGKSTYEQYKTIINTFKTFLELKGIDNHLSSMNYKTFKAYQDYMCDEEPKRVKTIDNKMSALIGLLRSVSKSKEYNYKFSDSEIDDLEMIPDLRSKWDRRSKQVALNEEQILKIYNCQGLTQKETEYRDLFCLQCWTGQRVSDILKLFDKNNYMDDNTIYFKNKKTKEDVVIKLDIDGYYIKDILKRYTEKWFENIEIDLLGQAMDASDEYDDDDKVNKKFRKMCANYNTIIKELGKKTELNTLTSYIEQIGRKLSKASEVFWRLMHSHSARHSYITNMLRRGISKDIIKITTGHADDEMIDMVYQHLTKEDTANKLHQGMNVVTNKDNICLLPKQPINKDKIEVLETINIVNNDDGNYINSINEAKEVLCFLGVDAEDYIDVYDFTKLLVMVGRQEAVLMDKLGLKTTEKFKELFNTQASVKERMKMLHELAKSIQGQCR